MPPETANQTPEQRLVSIFQEHGEGAMDGQTDPDERVPDARAQGSREQPRQEPEEPAAKVQEEEEKDKGQADPDTEGDDLAAADSGDEEATGDKQEEDNLSQEGIETTILAEILGIEDEGITVDEEGRPLFAVKIDGEDRPVPLPELRDGYSRRETFTQKSMELAEERQQFEQQKQAELQGFVTKAQVVDQVLAEHQQEVLSQYDKEDWDTLRRERPDEFAARRTEYAELYQKIGQRREAVQKEVLELNQRAQQEAFNERQKIAVEEGRRLRAAVKEWDTDEKAAKGAQAVDQFLRETYGFSPEDLANTLNHRAYLVALDAMRWRLQKTQEPAIRQRVVKAPRVMKPGVPTSAGEKRRVQTARVVKRHHKEKSVNSAAEAFLAKGIV